ncbi:MAG: hypothetical protein ACKVOQ_15135 [Cyclobacteriaceae bacterium]
MRKRIFEWLTYKKQVTRIGKIIHPTRENELICSSHQCFNGIAQLTIHIIAHFQATGKTD